MIYTCESCSAWYPEDTLRTALEKNEATITCPYCNAVTRFGEVRQSKIAKGYDALSTGEFGSAKSYFLNAISESKRHSRVPSPDAYLGCALCDFFVRTVFEESDPNKLNPPDFIYYTGKTEIAFTETAYYRSAIEACQGGSLSNDEYMRISGYGKTIDTVLNYYRMIDAERAKTAVNGKSNYKAFIAYEDDPEDGVENYGFQYANRVRNEILDAVDDVFLPDIENYNNDKLYYEAAILYAIEHSECMLVIADNDIDARLTGIYMRFYSCHNYDDNRLGFIRYLDKISVTVGNQRASNVFDYENGKDGYCNYVAELNGTLWKPPINTYTVTVVYGDGFTNDKTFYIEKDKGSFTLPAAPKSGALIFCGWDVNGFKHNANEPIDLYADTIVRAKWEKSAIEPVYERLPHGQFKFGSYPQRKEEDPKIVEYFNQYEKPTVLDTPEELAEKGWIPMFYSKALGNPYTWYRDETVNGTKYRAVYFTRYRDLYMYRSSDIMPREQKKQGYMSQHIYVFAFSPIIWNSIEQSAFKATLCANTALDSREFNGGAMNDWTMSSLRAWLNEDFLNTAFNERQRDALFVESAGTDKVFLVNQEVDKSYLKKKERAVLGSDYFKCLGGMCREFGAYSYWVLAETAGYVLYPASQGDAQAIAVDNTSVAVLPKVVLML